ncbi:MAG: hypothetical protein Q8896_04265 [Bacteroidota bacterium]|nr:hypothetical protein [Bacteroidota bacterium]
MKKIGSVNPWKALSLAFLIISVFSIGASGIHAQSARIVHTIKKLQKDPGSFLGRDLWFTMCQNYDQQGGKYYELFVTSPNNTTVNIQVTGGSTSRYPITAGQVLNFFVPLAWEVTTSGEVEQKAIRVWSNDADLTAYLLSRNPATSDGMYIIPTIGWGTEYVVAAYESLFEGYGSFVYDYPSEFSIVANQNNTICNITPNCDIRMTNGKPVRKAHVPFTEVLNRGECIQYKVTLATNADDFDVTGTVVTSNYPVGIVGASQCPNIPPEFPYCDHICDMIPPVRTWAQTYQTVPFAHRFGGDTYVVISSKPGQTVKRNGNVYCVLDNKYQSYFRADITDASQWTSDAPFLLAQYINSTTWPDLAGPNNNGVGDPAMVVVNSVEQYVPHIIFSTPNITNGGFQNFVNVMVNNDAKLTTTFDGQPIASFRGSTQLPVPGSNYTAFRISSVSPGKHTVDSDSGTGVYVYGYGNYDSYAWSAALGIKTYNDPDTIPPVAITSGDCFDALVTVTDNHKVPPASKIASMKLDSIYNMAYNPDPNYEEGVATDSTYYLMNVIDSSKEAILIIEIHDYAGNRTIVTSTYAPQIATLTPSLNNFGSGNVGSTTCKYFTVTNTGKTVFKWQSIRLLKGNVGFVDSIGNNDPIPVGGSRLVRVCFTPASPAFQSDTLEVFDGCQKIRALVIGTGGAPDFTAIGEDFQCQLAGSTTKLAESSVNNSSKSLVTIDSIWLDSYANFGFDPTKPAGNVLPFNIPPNGQHPIEFTFSPGKVGSYKTTAHFRSVQIGERTADIIGCAVSPGAHISKDTTKISDCATAVPFVFTIRDTGNYKMTITKVIVAGDPQFDPAPTSYTTLTGSPLQLPIQLDPSGEGAFLAYLNFIPAPKSSGIFSAKVFAVGPDAVTGKEDTTNFVTATVQAIYRELSATKPTITMAPVPFGSPAKTDVLTYCNQYDDPVTLQNVFPVPGAYNFAFSIVQYSVGGVAKTLPITLNKGECVDVTVQFNPSVSPDSVQTQNYSIVSNACGLLAASTAQAGVTLGPPTIQPLTLPTILSCDTKTGNVPVTNSNPAISPAMTITNVTFQGPNQANFSTNLAPLTRVSGGSTVQIPVTFTPTPSPGGPAPTSYSTNIVVTMTDASGNVVTLTAPINASANGMSAVVSSNFAIRSAQADEKTILVLPIDVAFTRNGLADQIDAFGITKIRLVYKYNTDILEPVGGANVANSVFALPSGWTVDPASALDNTAGTLTIILTGPALTDAQASAGSIGEVHFYPTLTQVGSKATTVSLTASDFLTASGAPVGNCLAISQQGTDFSLVYSCGDSTLAYFLKNGKAPSMIKPINPNPVSSSNGGIVNFQYVTKHEGMVSLVIFDELGKEVARVVNNQYHPAGTYEVRYDASKLASGSYIYRFQLDNQRALSGRMVVSN